MKLITKRNGVKYSIRDNRNRIFNPNEWNKFYFSLKESKKPVFDCLINTGARINEVLHLEKRDINFKTGTIILRIVKKRTKYSNGNQREIKVSFHYLERLRFYVKDMEENQLLFPVSKPSVSQLFKRGLKKVGLNEKEFSLHNIRKTTECWLAFLGANYLILLKHFGHNQSTALTHYLTTDIYNSKYKFKARQILGDLYM